jgi:hypothetical protein
MASISVLEILVVLVILGLGLAFVVGLVFLIVNVSKRR